MSPPTSSVCPPTPLCAYSSQALQHQSSSTTTNPPHPTPTVPLVYTETSLLPQPQASYLDQGSPMMPSTPRTSYIPLPPHTPSPNPRPPDSTHSSSHTLVLHPLLRYSQHSMPLLIWDVRTDPILASLLHEAPVSTNDGTIVSTHVPVLVPAHELHQPATTPPLRVLRLLCGIAPHDSTWSTINVTALIGITVLDVLNAVRECMRTPITGAEWDALCVKQQNRVNETFDSRWRTSRTPLAMRGNGVLRQDCLLLHTLWGGLMPSFVEDDVAVLTLRRQEAMSSGSLNGVP